MKKVLLLCLFFALVLASQYTKAQGLENFNNFAETSNVYHDSTFVGQDGSVWSYFQCRGDSVIVAPTPTLGKNRTPVSEVKSGSIAGGCGVLSFQYKQVFSTGVSLDVYVNSIKYKTVTSTSEEGVVKNSGDITINTSGSFILDFVQTSTNSGQVAIDNITWTGYTAGPLPEPTDYPASFTATPGGYKVTLTWTDAAGVQPPTSYLIKASTANNITLPVDGVPEPNSPTFVGGKAAMNILQGVQTYTFTGLPVNTPFFFEIFPYTNSGTLVNYKTAGGAPSANATTPNISVISKTNFDDYTFNGWKGYSVTGAQVWTVDSTHGYSTPACGKMSGYLAGNLVNEDWFYSPPLDFTNYTNPVFSFMSAYNYAGDPLVVKISTNYDGVSDPNTASWTDLAATLSPGGWAYTPSGDIDISGYSGNNVRLAFKYTSSATAASTWEIDDLLITGVRLVGVQEINSNEFSIYPNPSQGIVNLKFSNTEKKQIEVYSILGNSVYSETTSKGSVQLNLTDLNKGVYFIKISDQNGSTLITKKMILQ